MIQRGRLGFCQGTRHGLVWLNAYRLVPLRKMRFMACYTLPAPIAIHKNIRKATLHRGFSVSTPDHSQPTGIREIAIHVCMQVREFGGRVTVATILGTCQHCGAVDQCACKVSLFEFICQNAPQRGHIVLLRSAQPDMFDLDQRRLILQLTGWASCAMRPRTQQQRGEDASHGHSIPQPSWRKSPTILTALTAQTLALRDGSVLGLSGAINAERSFLAAHSHLISIPTAGMLKSSIRAERSRSNAPSFTSSCADFPRAFKSAGVGRSV